MRSHCARACVFCLSSRFVIYSIYSTENTRAGSHISFTQRKLCTPVQLGADCAAETAQYNVQRRGQR